MTTGRWGSAHTHSHFSSLDAMASVPELVAKAAEMNYSFLTLTDHGNMSGSVQLYEAGKEHGLKVFPGVEIYLLDPEYEGDLEKSGTAKRYHSCLAARNLDGYKALVKYVSLTHTRPRFSRFPRGLFSDLAELGQNSGDGVIYTTGCVFGLLQQTLLSKGEREATKLVSTMAKWFPHFFVELQNHNNVQEDGTTDDQIVEALAGIAARLGLPVIATPDTHYLNSMDADCHSLLKRMVYGNAEDAFPGGPYHLPSEEWVAEHYSPAIWDRVLEGADHYASLHDLVMPPLDKYKAQVPMMKKDPIKALRNRCLVVIDEQLADKKLKGGTRDDYVARLDHELSVIAKVGQGNYFLFMDRIIKQMRREGVFMDARGSASGSLVCYLLGITQVDPLFWGTDWDRFMGADRIQPPDIDMDIEDTSRWRVLAYLAENFDTMQIGTFSALGAYIDAEGNERGSIFQTYKTYIRSQVEGFAWDEEQILAAKENRKPVKGRALDAAKKKWFSIYEPNLKSLADAKYLDKKDHKLLQKMANMTLHKSYGVHAAGVLVSGAEMKIEDWVPSMLVPSSSTSVSQYTMKDVEKLGFMKGDWLGQTSLTVMRHCQELIGRDDPTDFTWIPFDDSATMKTCREFRQDTGIFHIEGYPLPVDSPVLTPTGWARMDSLKLGDEVVDPATGGVAHVTEIHRRGVEQVYRVQQRNGASVEASGEHIWAYELNGERREGTTNDLREMLEKTKYCPKLPRAKVGDLQHDKPRPVDPYVLGVLLGDGTLGKNRVVRLTTTHRELVDGVLAAYPELVAMQEKEQPKQFWFRNAKKKGENKLQRGLVELDLFGKRAWEKFVPEQYLWAPVSDRLALLQGLIDSDGIVKSDGNTRYQTTSDALKDAVVFLVRSLGGTCSVTTREAQDVGSFGTPTRKLWIVQGIVVPDFEIARVSYKKDNLRQRTRLVGWGIESIEPTRKTEVMCIGVSSKEATYITQDFIVTHNTKGRGANRMGVRNVRELVQVQALFMPGAMDSGATELFLKRHKSLRERKAVRYSHRLLKDVLGPTHGCLIYQEQVLSLARGVGITGNDLQDFFKVIKKSGAVTPENKAKMAHAKQVFFGKAREFGLSKAATTEAWTQIESMGGYGFNYSHAVAYGIRTYRTAYLKTHYPLEYMTALLTAWQGRPKENAYVKEARRIGIKILPAVVNLSERGWTMDKRGKAIRKGLVSIPGVGLTAAEEIEANAPYKDIQDFCQRVNPRKITGVKDWLSSKTFKGLLLKLHEAGALDELYTPSQPPF